MADHKDDKGLVRLTLVAAYGEKPPALAAFITETQARLTGLLGAAYAPYSLPQVHATLIGLEGEDESGTLVNRNYRQIKGRVVTMDCAKIPVLLRRMLTAPMTIRMAGYRIENAYPFTSRSAHPARRSFSIQGNQAVIMGWPADANGYPLTLNALRRTFNAVGVLHKYHIADESIDNDCYFVLGRIDRAVHIGSLNTIEEQMREYLSAHPPVESRSVNDNSVSPYTKTKVFPDLPHVTIL